MVNHSEMKIGSDVGEMLPGLMASTKRILQNSVSNMQKSKKLVYPRQ